MKLSKEEVQKIADLARIELKNEEIEKYRDQLSDILGYVNKLQEVDTKGVEAVYLINPAPFCPNTIETERRWINSWRADEVKGCGADERGLILDNMPDKEGDELKTMGIFKK